ncbi:hypothetical protein BN946_scf185022.g4 [Trametes cinnabarina]|uniref:Uncharacterized protein n=1 Tax=Pycnoporus cinnabarinus TaxID=5643 RepID=A0A060SRL7_PYCCI|nr:hypothetical protein BN946_scf185022.g4 [Trametes cinnabarina]
MPYTLPTALRYSEKAHEHVYKPRSHRLRFMARRYLVLALTALVLLVLLGRLFWHPEQWFAPQPFPDIDPTPLPPPPEIPAALPPLYERYHQAELTLPQHGWQQPRPREHEKFLFVAGCGWGNAMQELVLNAYMAYKSNRSYANSARPVVGPSSSPSIFSFVFANYTWNDNGSPYSDYNGKKIPSLIPYSALIRGPIVGGPYPPGDRAPLSVHRDYFDHVCPQKTTFIREDVSEIIHYKNSAKEIVDGWHDKLAAVAEPCVQTAPNSGQIFNFEVFGDPQAMLDIWPELAASPILTHFGWSPLVELAFDTNRDLFFPADAPGTYLTDRPFTTNADRYGMIPGLMAIHVRRGDFEGHCAHLATFSSQYNAFNSFTDMVTDAFVPPAPAPAGPAEAHQDERWETYREHCYPSIEQIVRRVRAVRATRAARGLKKLYVMTNGDTHFVAELRAALWRDQDWEGIASSRDLVLGWEQKYVAQAVDMLIGQRAQILIGNGVGHVAAACVAFG